MMATYAPWRTSASMACVWGGPFDAPLGPRGPALMEPPATLERVSQSALL
jgi:hypothetical protein